MYVKELLRARYVHGHECAHNFSSPGSGRIYLRKEDCGRCGRWVGAKINIWMQGGKHDILSTQLREMQKRRSLLVLKTIKKTSFMLPNKCFSTVHNS